MTRRDMPERLASWADALPDSVTSRLLREAADELSRLRLTDAERVVIEAILVDPDSAPANSAATMRGLLERLG